MSSTTSTATRSAVEAMTSDTSTVPNVTATTTIPARADSASAARTRGTMAKETAMSHSASPMAATT